MGVGEGGGGVKICESLQAYNYRENVKGMHANCKRGEGGGEGRRY